MIRNKKYNTSFIVGLIFNESIIAAQLYLKLKDWDNVQEQIQKDRLLQTRTDASAKRYLTEVKKRLENLSPMQLEILAGGLLDDQKYIYWWAICQAYDFIKEFTLEVIRSKFLSMDYKVDHIDYIRFFDIKAEIDPSLNNRKDYTKLKQEQVLFRILRGTGIIDKNNNVTPVSLSQKVIEALASHKPDSFLVFPIRDDVLRGIL